MTHTTFRAADGLNDTPVSPTTPLPIELRIPNGSASDWSNNNTDSAGIGTTYSVAAALYAFNGLNFSRLRTATGALGSAGYGLAVEEAGRSYGNYLANGSAVVKSGAGVLHSITVNTRGATGNVLTLYDNTAASGTKIATIDTTAAVGAILYDVAFSTGLSIAMANGTAADITVSYR
jgi:hypothetical protein